MFFGMDFSNSPLCPYFTHNLIIFCDILLLRSTLIFLRLSHIRVTSLEQLGIAEFSDE